MGIYLEQQTMFFLQSVLLGFAFGLAYDCFRIARIAVRTAAWAVFIQDILFFFLCAVSTFFFMLRTIDGQLRFFILMGEALGALLYFLTLSILVMKVSTALINAVKAALRFVFYRIFLPVWRLLYAIVAIIMRPVRFLSHFIRKNAKRCKYRLKVRRKVLYNQLGSIFITITRPKRKRNANDPTKTQEEP